MRCKLANFGHKTYQSHNDRLWNFLARADDPHFSRQKMWAFAEDRSLVKHSR
jgi:hypothetical protein